ncbi:MAG TPA: glycosyltransferase family 4 protein [Actinomycetota bacterium]|nr:glycosyltransferase family 4 protein [Actinomycetota bacterium]
MRILLACPYAWDAPGGVQVHVRQLAGQLRERGHEVRVLAPASHPPRESFVRAVGRPFRISYNQSVAPIAPTLGALGRVRTELRDFRPDLVHVHEPMVPGPAMFATLASKAPVVATFHAFADASRLLDLAAPALRPVWRRLAVRVAVSEAAAEFVARRFGRGDIRVIPNGADVELFRDAEPAELPKGRRILFVNRLDRRKGFPVMVQAFGRLAADRPDVVLVVIGDGADRNAVRDLTVDARSRVVMLGSVPHDKLPPYHAASELFCAPAIGRESFGIVLVEAMAAGLPVVASDIPGYREVVRDGIEGILVPPRNPAALAEAIGRLLDDPGTAKQLGAAGRERAQRFSWHTVAGELEDLYREVVGERAAAGG